MPEHRRFFKIAAILGAILLGGWWFLSTSWEQSDIYIQQSRALYDNIHRLLQDPLPPRQDVLDQTRRENGRLHEQLDALIGAVSLIPEKREGGISDFRKAVTQKHDILLKKAHEMGVGIDGKLGFEDEIEQRNFLASKYYANLQLAYELVNTILDVVENERTTVHVDKIAHPYLDGSVRREGQKAFIVPYTVEIDFSANLQIIMKIIHRFSQPGKAPFFCLRRILLKNPDNSTGVVEAHFALSALAVDKDADIASATSSFEEDQTTIRPLWEHD